MPHTTNLIYRDTQNGVGVSIGDIQAVLGSPRNDIGGLITYGNINKWAKYKPIRSNKLGILNDTDRANAQQGLSISPDDSLGTPTNASTFLGKLVAGQLGWEYLRPRGGSNSPKEWFRFLDFDGYNSECVCPVGDVVTDIPIDTSGNATIAWDMITVGSDNVQLSDINIGGSSLSTFYLGVLLLRGTTWNVVTSTTAVGSNDVQIVLSNATSLAGTWRAYPFFSSVQIPLGTSTGTGVYVSAGWDANYAEVSFRLTSESLTIYAYGIWNASYTAISIEWVAYNEDSAAKTVTPTVFLRKNTTGDIPVSESTLTSMSLGSITVPAKSGSTPGEQTGTATLSYTAGSDHDDYFWWLGVQVPDYTTQYMQVEEPDIPLEP